MDHPAGPAIAAAARAAMQQALAVLACVPVASVETEASDGCVVAGRQLGVRVQVIVDPVDEPRVLRVAGEGRP